MMRNITKSLPEWLDPSQWISREYGSREIAAALESESPGPGDLAALLAPDAAYSLEILAHRARAVTRRHFGRTISLYAPLYLSNHCSSGCAYCGYASDRDQARRKLSLAEVRKELSALKRLGLREVLLLTGDKTPDAGYEYVEECVRLAAGMFPFVAVEVFPLTVEEYRGLVAAGCSGVTIYQETYSPADYKKYHRWGEKKNYMWRLETPDRALDAGMRWVGMGFLLGLSDPVVDSICLLRHVEYLRRKHWRAGISVSFPRLCAEKGGFKAPRPVDDKFLARMICAFRICLPDTPLVLSTRESARFRDGMAGIGISKMSVASRTSVGGYAGKVRGGGEQFGVNDGRSVREFCARLKAAGLEPVFKNWDAVYR